MTNNVKNRILVTGASGSIGSEIVKRLSTSNAVLRLAVHSNDSMNKLTKISVGGDFAQIDYDKPDSIGRACSDVDRVFLLVSGPRAMEHVSRFIRVQEGRGKAYCKNISSAGRRFTWGHNNTPTQTSRESN